MIKDTFASPPCHVAECFLLTVSKALKKKSVCSSHNKKDWNVNYMNGRDYKVGVA